MRWQHLGERYRARQVAKSRQEEDWQSRTRASTLAVFTAAELETTAAATKKLPGVRPEVLSMVSVLGGSQQHH